MASSRQPETASIVDTFPVELLGYGINRKRDDREPESDGNKIHEPGVGDHLTLRGKYRMAHVNHFFRVLYGDSARQYSHDVHAFLLAVVQGEEAKVLATLKKDPELLLEKGSVTDYSGRTFRGLTAFQLMLSAGDTDMIAKVMKFFDKIPYGQEEKAKQFAEQFPDGLIEQAPFDFSTIVNAISHGDRADIQAVLDKKCNIPVDQVLNTFRADFTARSMQEANFNPNHLQKAFALYEEKFASWNWDQRNLFWQQVIGYVQRFLPSCYAQAFSQGVYYLVEKHETLRRSFDFRYGCGSFFPLTSNSLFGLGYDYVVVNGGLQMVGRERGGLYSFFYKIMCEQKQRFCRTYAAAPIARLACGS